MTNVRFGLIATLCCALPLVSACGDKGGTFVLVNLERGAAPDGIVKIDLALDLDGKTANTTLQEKGGGTIAFPTSTTLSIGQGAGNLRVTAIARGADGGELATSTGMVTVVKDKSVTLSLTLGEAAPDLSQPDLAGDMSGTTVPGAPTSVVASSGVASATVSWMAPASDGGSPVTMYSITSSPATTTKMTSSLNVQFNGLTNGTPYTFTVVAINSVGAGPGADSNVATPLATPIAPSAPGTPFATVGGAFKASVTWTAANNNGSPISSYTVTSNPGGLTATTADGATLTATIGGLTNGLQYTFTVTATNGIGTGPASAPSNLITAIDVPTAPTGLSACAANGRVTLGYTLPASATAANVYYKTSAGVTKANGTKVPNVAKPAVVTGLTNSTTYFFVIVAVNAAGESVESTELSAFPTLALKDQLVVVTGPSGTGNIDIFDCLSQLPAGSAPTRSISDAQIDNPQFGSIGIDTTRGSYYLGNTSGSSVLIWDAANTLTGAVAPTRKLAGTTNVKFAGIRGVTVDSAHNRLWVNDGSNGVRAWDSANTVNGDVAPVAALTGFSSVNQIYVDENTDRLFVVSYGNGVYVFSSSSTLAGTMAGPASATKLFAITGATNFIGVAADSTTLYMSTYVANGSVYSLAGYFALASGTKAASTTLNPNAMTTNAGNLTVRGNLMAVIPDNDATSRIFLYNSASTAAGTAAPDKIVTVSPHTHATGVALAP